MDRDIPALMSAEARAQAIADEACSTEYAGNPSGRREGVRKFALAHIRAALASAGTDFYAQTAS